MIALGLIGVVAVVAVAVAVWLRTPGDTLSVLFFALTGTFVLGQRFVVTGLDTAGAPALLIGVLLFSLWALGRVHPRQLLDRHADVGRMAFYGWMMLWLLGNVVGMMNPGGGHGLESLVRSMMGLMMFTGVGLYASDAIRTPNDLQRLLRALSLFGGFVALVGIVQFVTRTDPLTAFAIPGLQQNSEAVRIRSNFLRARGTAFHPIEFSVVLSMLLPVAIHTARTATSTASRRLAGASAVACAAGALISVSRSGVVTIVVALVVVQLGWSWMERARYGAYGMVVLVGVYMLVPGLLGTLRGLFANAENDPSIIARQDDVPFVLGVVRESPAVGIGSGQVTVEDILLDNEFYGRLISGGVIGLIGFALVLLAPAIAAYARSQIGEDEAQRSAGAAIAAGIIAAFVSFATFDGFFFMMFVSVLSVLLAAGGAAYRLRRFDAAALEAAPLGTLIDASRQAPNPYAARWLRRRERARRAAPPASSGASARGRPRHG